MCAGSLSLICRLADETGGGVRGQGDRSEVIVFHECRPRQTHWGQDVTGSETEFHKASRVSSVEEEVSENQLMRPETHSFPLIRVFL